MEPLAASSTLTLLSDPSHPYTVNQSFWPWSELVLAVRPRPFQGRQQQILASHGRAADIQWLPRGDEVEIETWFQAEGRIAACRNWLIRDKASGRQLGQGTR